MESSIIQSSIVARLEDVAANGNKLNATLPNGHDKSFVKAGDVIVLLAAAMAVVVVFVADVVSASASLLESNMGDSMDASVAAEVDDKNDRLFDETLVLVLSSPLSSPLPLPLLSLLKAFNNSLDWMDGIFVVGTNAYSGDVGNAKKSKATRGNVVCCK